MSFDHDGRSYTLTPYDFSALDELEIHRVTGATLTSIFTGRATTLFTVAALLWRTRVNDGEDDLAFTDVAKTFGYRDMETISNSPKEGGSPEA